MIGARSLIVAAFSFVALGCYGQTAIDRNSYELGHAALELAAATTDRVWPGIGALTRGFVVIDGDREVLVCRDQAPGFERLAESPLSGCVAHERDRFFPERMQASLNLFGLEETVVTASPQALDQSDAEWLLKFVHERFHQWQSTQPRYLERIAALDLSGGDTSGMWMLNFPFPYDDPDTAAGFAELGARLAALQTTLAADDEASRISEYIERRAQVFARLPAAARRYAEFQLWKEGAARYTEIATARQASAQRYRDHSILAAAAADIERRELARLRSLDLATDKRGVFYALGLFEWQLADQLAPDWRRSYAAGPLAVAPYLIIE